MKKRLFLIPSLLAAGFVADDAKAATPSEEVKTPDDRGSLLKIFRLEHKYTLAKHSSHSSHGSHGSHGSHRSSSGGGTYTPPPPPPPPPPSRNNDSTPPSTVLPSSPAIAPQILPGNSEKFRAIVRQVQTGLYVYGYYTGAIDGIVGPQTRTAISQFQKAYGQQVTGTITPEVLDALGIVAQ